MMQGRNRSHFRRGTKPTFMCRVCERRTRNPDDGGTELCAECFELAGMDNMVNDNAMELTEAIITERDALFAAAVKKGGNGEIIKRENGYLWPKGKNCPKCGADVWDVAFGHKLNKCWNCLLAFD